MQALQRSVGSGHGIVYSIFQGITHPLHAAGCVERVCYARCSVFTLPLSLSRPQRGGFSQGLPVRPA